MKRIHLTESQLKYCIKKIQEANDDEITIDAQPSAGGVVDTNSLKQQYNNAKTKVGGNTEVNLKVSGTDLQEDVEEGKVASWDADVQEVENYLNSIKGSPDYYRVFDMFEGNIDQERQIVQELSNTVGVSRNIIAYVLKKQSQGFNYDNGDVEDSLPYAMECRKFTKKQIKEAKLRKMLSESRAYKKKDIRK